MGRKRIGVIGVGVIAGALAGCAAPQPIYDMRVWDQAQMKEVDLSPRDVVLVELECRELANRVVMANSGQFIHNVGNWDWARANAKCLEDRGFKLLNADAFKVKK